MLASTTSASRPPNKSSFIVRPRCRRRQSGQSTEGCLRSVVHHSMTHSAWKWCWHWSVRASSVSPIWSRHTAQVGGPSSNSPGEIWTTGNCSWIASTSSSLASSRGGALPMRHTIHISEAKLIPPMLITARSSRMLTPSTMPVAASIPPRLFATFSSCVRDRAAPCLAVGIKLMSRTCALLPLELLVRSSRGDAATGSCRRACARASTMTQRCIVGATD
mmetsp:Transcript_65229/g.167892  ORF Transcript_65229/g.167892 Transcript_65229/m.167892 type:complete len:219 (+) Transcript_65229:767-1423(+)